MTLTANRVVALCERAAYYLREDLHLMEAGSMEVRLFGQNVTDKHADRLKGHLSRVQEIIDGCGCDCA